MSREQLTRPVIIKPDTGNDDGKSKGNKPVFCNIIQDGHLIRSGELGKRDAEDLYQMARNVIQGSTHAKQNKAPRPQASTRTEQQSSVDWKVFCRQYGVFPEALKDLANELGLPQGKLNTRQTAQLYDEAWKKFVEKSA